MRRLGSETPSDWPRISNIIHKSPNLSLLFDRHLRKVGHPFTDTQAFDVQTVTAFGTNSGRGNLAAGFGFSLSSMTEDDNRFIMGGMLEVSVQWNVDFLGKLYILLASSDLQRLDEGSKLASDWKSKFEIST